MKAMILAAGRGYRLRPITDSIPKPLLKVAGRSLIEHHIVNLAAAGIYEIVINHAYLGEQITETLGDGSRYGVKITYSPEPEGGLETGGGVYQALPILGSEPFIVLNADFYTDYPFAQLPKDPKSLVHLVLVDVPADAEHGDFPFYDGQFDQARERNVTFAGISVYRPEFFKDCQPGRFSLTPYLKQAVTTGQASGEYFDGFWFEIGTPTRWQTLQDILQV